MTADFAWLTEHSLEIYEKYAGKWIAVHNGEVVGVGDTATEAAAQAEAKCPNGNFLFEWVDPELERI
ncbi:MAG: hypothetical protein HZA51_16335 [Planctomycetes bacterium]|nr:hypothetical protein [Planctomycetota bacterium]